MYVKFQIEINVLKDGGLHSTDTVTYVDLCKFGLVVRFAVKFYVFISKSIILKLFLAI